MLKFCHPAVFRVSVAVLLLTAPAAASAGDAPLCGRPEIVTVAEDYLKQTEAHLAIMPNTAAEVRTLQSNVVLCVVTVRVSIYDLAVYRDYPTIILESRYFEARRLRDGVEVDFTGR